MADMMGFLTTGWVKLMRIIVDSRSYDHPLATAAYCHALLRANINDCMVKGILLKRGQFLTSIEQFASECGMSEKQMRNALDMLSSDGLIKKEPAPTRANNKADTMANNMADIRAKNRANNRANNSKRNGTIITVVNYDFVKDSPFDLEGGMGEKQGKEIGEVLGEKVGEEPGDKVGNSIRIRIREEEKEEEYKQDKQGEQGEHHDTTDDAGGTVIQKTGAGNNEKNIPAILQGPSPMIDTGKYPDTPINQCIDWVEHHLHEIGFHCEEAKGKGGIRGYIATKLAGETNPDVLVSISRMIVSLANDAVNAGAESQIGYLQQALYRAGY